MTAPFAVVLNDWHVGLGSPDDAARMASAKGVAGFMEDCVFVQLSWTSPLEKNAAFSKILTSCAHHIKSAMAAALAPQNDAAFADLQMFLAACDRMLDGIMNVGQFGEPMAHQLFYLVDASIVGELVSSLRNSRKRIGCLRKTDLITARGIQIQSCASNGAILATCIALAYGVLGSRRLQEIASFTHGLYAAISSLPDDVRIHDASHSAAAEWMGRVLNNPNEVEEEYRDALWRGLLALEFCCRLLGEASTSTTESIKHMACQIIRQKATYAVLHHKGQMLGPRRLVEWFSTQPFDAQGMLDALYASSWIDRTDVRRSRFFVELNGPKGKMHGVFSVPEIDILVRYFEGLSPQQLPETGIDDGASALQTFIAWILQSKIEGSLPMPVGLSAVPTPKDRYFALLDMGPRGTAQSLASQVVASALRETQMVRDSVSLPAFCSIFDYSPQELKRRIDQAYWAGSAKSVKVRALSCEAVRERHLRFAPMALVDGCWLHKITALRRDSPALALLYRIFADEVGNGVLQCNHANLYVSLLRSLDIDIENAASDALRDHPQVPAQAFKLPTFLLALGVVCCTHIPEVLGATLAIELSGLDEFYDAMIEDLESMQKDASFWRVHVSVDNYSSGHARQALQAIILYMDELLQRYGPEAVQPVWQRIWLGFVTTIFLLGVELSVVMGMPGKVAAS